MKIALFAIVGLMVACSAPQDVIVLNKKIVPERTETIPEQKIVARGAIGRIPASELKIPSTFEFTVRLPTYEEKTVSVSKAMYDGVRVGTRCTLSSPDQQLLCPPG